MTKQTTKDLERAEELMTLSASTQKKIQALTEKIKVELEVYGETLDQAEKELLEIGERNKHLFVSDNLKLKDGYLHISHNGFVKTGRKFDINVFKEAYPNLVDITKALLLGPIKKAFQDKAERKLLKSLGVEIDTTDKMSVVIKPQEEEVAKK